MFKINYKKEFNKALSVVRMDQKVIDEIARDEKSTNTALAIIVAPLAVALVLFLVKGVMTNIATFWWYFAPQLLSVVGIIAFYWASGEIANRFFRGKGIFKPYLRVMGYASVLYWVSVVTYLGMFLGLSSLSALGMLASLGAVCWMIYINFQILRKFYKLKEGDTVVVMVVTLVVVAIVYAILSELLVAKVVSSAIGFQLHY